MSQVNYIPVKVVARLESRRFIFCLLRGSETRWQLAERKYVFGTDTHNGRCVLPSIAQHLASQRRTLTVQVPNIIGGDKSTIE